MVPFGFGLPRYEAQSRTFVRLAARSAGSPRPSSRRGRVFRFRGTLSSFRGAYAVALSCFGGQRNASPLTSIRCRITASLRARATQAFLWLVRFLTRRAQSFSG